MVHKFKIDFICSDTNIWIDFSKIGALKLPFKLSFMYLMEIESFKKEILDPPDLQEKLIKHGLQLVEMNGEERNLSKEYFEKYGALSLADCTALAIAKNRGIILLTGDGTLRKAAKKEGVEVKGTIWILDQLLKEKKIEAETYQKCISSLLENNGDKVRLPEEELLKRLDKIFEKHCALAGYSQNNIILRKGIISTYRNL